MPEVEIRVKKNGPYVISGPVVLKDPDGNTYGVDGGCSRVCMTLLDMLTVKVFLAYHRCVDVLRSISNDDAAFIT